ncbi:MAG: preprotein translocase subunit SecY [Planctomycetota bacterium]
MNAVINLFRIPDLRKKIYLTFLLLLVYRMGFHIPLPGVDWTRMEEIGNRFSSGAVSYAFGIMNTLSGGSIASCAIFSLGVMPYISASIILSLLTKVVPALEQLSKEGQAGQKKINQYNRLLTVPLCVVQSLLVIRGILAQGVDELGIIDPVKFHSFWYQVFVILTFTVGTLFVMWLGEQITEYGIGNGISLIIMSGIVSDFPGLFAQYLGRLTESSERVQTVAMFIALYAAVVFFVVYITKAQRRIPIQQAKLMRGRRIYGGSRHYLPLKVNQANVMPIIFASALFILPTYLGKIPGLHFIGEVFSYGKFWYILAYCGLIYFFSFFWTALMFQPNELANNLKEYGGFIPGLRPGKRTADFLESVMVKITLAGATFLAIIALLPQVITSNLTLQPYLAHYLGGTSILIVVGVCLDLVDKLNSFLVMRNYDGFMGGSSSSWARERKR